MEVSSENPQVTQNVEPGGRMHGFLDFDRFSDEEIWASFKSGSAEVFEFVYIKYFPILFNYGRQFTKDSDLVKDIIQDLFIYLQEKRDGLGDVTSIRFYLYKSFKNRIVRHLNKNVFSWEVLDYENNVGFDIMLGHDDAGVLSEELRQKVENAFTTLSQRQKEIIVYYFYEGFTYAQITSLMGFGKVEYARILMSRTILKLRKVMGESIYALELMLLTLPANY
jgi:RNA polymerase sigma factor (sigma-70 family)